MGEYEARRAFRQLSAARPPVPGQQLVDAVDRVIGDAGEHVAQVTLRIETIHLGGLCRAPNYAERACFPQDSR
jgi:hypothetical protein